MDMKFVNNQPSLNPEVGSYGPWGSVAGNACGAIAMTNVCLMDGMKDIDLDFIIKKNLSKWDGVVLGGALGTNPFAVKKVLEELGFKVKYLGSFRNTAQVKKYKYFIVLYSWVVGMQIGAHYQAGRVLPDGWLELYNPYHKYKDVAQFKQFEKALCPVVFGIN